MVVKGVFCILKNSWKICSNEVFQLNPRRFSPPIFLQPMYCVLCLVTQLYLTLCDPVDCNPPGSSVHAGFSRQEYWCGLPCPAPGDLPHPGIELESPALQADSTLSEPPGKSTNTGVGSLSLLQGIFPTQGLNLASCIAGGFITSRATREAPQPG